MPVFELKSQKEIDENYQGINISEFTYVNSDNISEENLIVSFIHSKSFAEDSRREIIKNDTANRPFLRQAFEINLVSISDFKQLDKNGIKKFLDDYAEADDWGEDGNDFIKIKDGFIELLKGVESNYFYLLSKEWFEETDEKLREPENWIYTYYFLIIWIDKANKILTVSEWTYD
ncbi:MAG TPA: hypothetical protein VIL74_21070 [Pyrinomonadaceae bacterium]|jgi:hypothetical protein